MSKRSSHQRSGKAPSADILLNKCLKQQYRIFELERDLAVEKAVNTSRYEQNLRLMKRLERVGNFV